MDRDELIEALFEGELQADEVRTLRQAMEQRIAAVQAARQRGEPVDAAWTDTAELQRQLAVLREEEVIADFVARALDASLNRAEILRRLSESEALSGDP